MDGWMDLFPFRSSQIVELEIKNYILEMYACISYWCQMIMFSTEDNPDKQVDWNFNNRKQKHFDLVGLLTSWHELAYKGDIAITIL